MDVAAPRARLFREPMPAMDEFDFDG